MTDLNFSIRPAQPGPFNPRTEVSLDVSSVLWTAFAALAVASVTFAIVWFA